MLKENKICSSFKKTEKEGKIEDIGNQKSQKNKAVLRCINRL